MYWKFHSHGTSVVLAACDDIVLGKTLPGEDGLQLIVSKVFYEGEHGDAAQLQEQFLKAPSLNLVGKEVVALALSLKLLDKTNILFFGDVPHALVFQL